MGLNRDVLENKDTLMRYPKLEEFTTDILYQKALVLQRSAASSRCYFHSVQYRWAKTGLFER